MRLERTGPRARGWLGTARRQRANDATNGLTPAFESAKAGLYGEGAVTWTGGTGASWSPRPLPANISDSAGEAARTLDAVSVADHGDHTELHGGISGAAPIYVDVCDDGVNFASSIEPLLASRPTIRPDWDGWAQMLAAGAPLGGRTTIDGISRLRPWERVTVDSAGTVRAAAESWPWLDLAPGEGASVSAVAEALAAAVREVGNHTTLAPMLSGGWDSRLLTVLAHHSHPDRQIIARTTSSDTGTVMEELVAAKVAEHLGVEHRILAPRWDQFAADLNMFAAAADFQTAFHVWFVPIQRDLNRAAGTALDGLGGGLFLGGAFPDPPGSQPVLDRRFARLTHYLKAAPGLLAPEVIDTIRERTRAGFDEVAEPLVDHPFAATFTAYLNRTLPGISLAPNALLASATTVATPFLDDDVVTAALSIPPDEHVGGVLYPRVMAQFDEYLAGVPTAENLAPWPRPHPRRIASPAAARRIRDLVLAEPTRPLVSANLVGADLSYWQQLLSTTGSQHLLRSLAVMSLWFRAHKPVLAGQDARGMLE